MNHILFQNTTFHKRRTEIKPPVNFEYDYSLGAWVSQIDQSLLIISKDFPTVSTKKNDIETGEDQKGQ